MQHSSSAGNGDTTPITPSAQQIRATMLEVTRRQWWLWSEGLTVALVLALGVASFAFPGLLSEQIDSDFYRLNLNLAVRGLVGLILLFGIYVVHQQHQLHKIDASVDAQISILGEVQHRARKDSKSVARDSLTNLYTKRFGEERLLEEMSRSARYDKPLTVLRMNLNGIPEIDKILGSDSADYVIRLFAERLQSKIRRVDVPIHLDRGKFLVLLPHCNGSVTQVVKRLDQMTFEFGVEHTEIVAGWADYVKGEQPQTLLIRAESVLDTNKPGENRRAVKVAFLGIDDRIAALTPREREIIKLLAQGKPTKEVSDCLGIKVRTLDKHRENLMEKLDIHSTYDLILFAIRNKIVDI